MAALSLVTQVAAMGLYYLLGAYSSADTVLRIITSPNMGSSDSLFFDNVQIQCN